MATIGTVFNIQKFSIHDGPGIRSTVFLKGCPLRCKWCANPESQLAKVQVMYDFEKCLHCLSCVQLCEEKAVSLGEDNRIFIDFNRCTGCMRCVQSCPGRALTGEGEHKTVEAVLEVCLQDQVFYEESGGGVTISGGEGLLQPEFTLELIHKLKRAGIHTAIETTGAVSEEVFRLLAPEFDLLLFDIKHHDPERHKAGTGVSNERIVRNLDWAVRQGLTILPRVAVIPGFNDRMEDAAGIASLLLRLGLKRVQLLPFHQMGERKYEYLNRPYSMAGIANLHPEDLTAYRRVFLDAGIDCFI